MIFNRASENFQWRTSQLSVISYQLSVGKLSVIRCEFLSVQY
ncbi:hypothetical protein PN437_00970 [Microcystis aeruginosa CS-564/01]|nr:hypothetical protein [Microcystis aeruginosa CS-564/01]